MQPRRLVLAVGCKSVKKGYFMPRAGLRIGLTLVMVMLLAGAQSWGRTAQAQQPPRMPAAVDPGQESFWVAGTGFHIRDGSIAYSYDTAGCLYANSSADFTADVQLPQGAAIDEVRYYFFDTDTAVDQSGESRVELMRFNGLYTSEKLATVYSNGDTGYGETVQALGLPVTVDNQNYALALDWYPIVTDTTMQLCGVQIVYTPAQTPVLGTSYTRIAGSAFHRRSRAVDYGYAGGGCTYLRTPDGTMTADVNLPAGADLYGMRVYYKDQLITGTLAITLTEYDGLGNSTPLVVLTTTDYFDGNGYTDIYTDVQTIPYTVNPELHALAVEVSLSTPLTDTGALGQAQFCGVRLGYAAPDPETLTSGQHARFIAGSTFHPRAWNVDWSATAAGCVYTADQNESLAAALQLPDGVQIQSITHYYRDTSAANTVLTLAEYDGLGNQRTLATAPSAGNGGYGQNSVDLTTRSIVNTDSTALAFNWQPGDAGAATQFCGAKVTYAYVSLAYIPLLLK